MDYNFSYLGKRYRDEEEEENEEQRSAAIKLNGNIAESISGGEHANSVVAHVAAKERAKKFIFWQLY